ncbi:UNVERIFIED_CONTAM: hypothetical protein FKN15_062998 [Acipenser sinensis]
MDNKDMPIPANPSPPLKEQKDKAEAGSLATTAIKTSASNMITKPTNHNEAANRTNWPKTTLVLSAQTTGGVKALQPGQGIKVICLAPGSKPNDICSFSKNGKNFVISRMVTSRLPPPPYKATPPSKPLPPLMTSPAFMTSPPNFNGIRALLKPPFLNSNSNTPSQANSPFRWYLTRPPWQQSSPAARPQRVSVPLLQRPAPASVPGLAAELRFEPPSPGYSRGVFENFRKWQQYKELAKQHYHSSPDLEALSCFFM